MKSPNTALRTLERRSITARAEYDRLRAATTQARNAMTAMQGLAKTTADATLEAALAGYGTFSESMLTALEAAVQRLKAEINDCAAAYAKELFGFSVGDRVSANNVMDTHKNTVIEIHEMGIDEAMAADGVHKQVYIAGPRIGTQGTTLKRSAWLMLGNPMITVTKL